MALRRDTERRKMGELASNGRIARVTLEIAVQKDFDYLIPPHLEREVVVGVRVQAPFGRRKVFGYVTALPEKSEFPELKELIQVARGPAALTSESLRLARWMADYYQCPVETALKSVLPDAVRRQEAGWKERLYVRALPAPDPFPKLTSRQQEVWEVISEWREMSLTELLKVTGCTAPVVRKLESAHLVTVRPEVSERDPHAGETLVATSALPLNDQQGAALDKIKDSMRAGSADVYLLHGVTGSGKTEVYLQAIAEALEKGQGAIVLVPEISLTPQTVERFKARFSSGDAKTLVAVLHSHLSAGERHDEWHKIREGRAKIVIGARSAIFAPIAPLGLIVTDEEHESSYKQEEAPRYNARDLAVVRGKMENAVVVLGSATPSMESFYNAKNGKYQLIELTTRADDAKMPIVRVMDMRMENRKQKALNIFSQQLKEAILQRLERKEQTMLFLNRRGYSTSLQCTSCGFVAECGSCSVSLTFHRAENVLVCHICGYRAKAPKRCPECGDEAIRWVGLGTEKVEETLRKLFPHANVERMDSDALKKKEDFKRILSDFRLGKTDILIGTQMIAKGLHFPNVTLVGLVNADLSLHVPDFRAGERTFQLITQVSGRAGRGDIEGEVYVQSFSPFHPAIQYARRHDFEGFYDYEIEHRQELRYPPLSRIVLVTVRGQDEEAVAQEAVKVKDCLREELKNFSEVIIAGPGPAPLQKAEGYYRFQIMVRAPRIKTLKPALEALAARSRKLKDMRVVIDVDPMSLC